MQANTVDTDIPQFIRTDQVQMITGLSRSQLLLMVNDGRFPRPIKLCGKRAVGYVKSEVVEWANAAIANNRIGVGK